MAHDLAEEILQKLSLKDELDTFDIAEDMKLDHQKIIGAVKSIQALGNLITGKM